MGYKVCAKGVPIPLSENFTSTEFDCHGRSCCSQTKINEGLVEYLQKIREHFGVPISVTSGYRCIQHNSNIGSGTGSQHVKGNAADIVVKGVAPAEVAKFAESIGILGIGLYETSSDGFFVHIDTRTTKAFWYGQAQRYRSTFGGTQPVTTGSNSTDTNTLDTILNRGDTGTAVKELQEKLIRLGYSCGNRGADGMFGSATERAVKQFQKNYGGLASDGIAGYQTLSAIDIAVEQASDATKVQVTANVLNVRSGAGMSYSIVSTVRKGATCILLEEKNGWGKILSPSGWINSQYYKSI